MISINIEPLTTASFAPFGSVIEFRGEALTNNQGRCRKFPALANIHSGGSGSVNVHLFMQPEAIQLPFTLQVLESHPRGSQLFMPLNQVPYLVVVAMGKEQPDLDSIRCFYTNSGQGIVYGPGVWHHPLLALTECAEFIVADAAVEESNLVEVFLDQSDSYLINRLVTRDNKTTFKTLN